VGIIILLMAVAAWGFWPVEVKYYGPSEARPWIKRAKKKLREEGKFDSANRWSGPKVVLVGVDGMDMDHLRRFVERGRMPNLERLMKEGASGKLLTLFPALSPRIWTTIATGVLPRHHGIVNMVMKSPETGQVVLLDASERKFPALWDMASAFGLNALVVNYWTTWPAEKINGVMISDLVPFALRGKTDEKGKLQRLAYPPGMFEKVFPYIRKESEIPPSVLRRFLNAFDDEILEMENKGNMRGMKGHIGLLRTALAADLFTVEAGLELYRERDPDLFIIYFKGLDLVCHRFWKYYHPEKFEGIAERELRVAKDVIPRYYEFVDEMVGRLLEEIPKDTWLMVVSDHGFAADPDNPTRSGTHFKHVRYSAIIARGPVIEPATGIKPAFLPERFPTTGCRVTDVTPTILYWLGLPLAENFVGKPCSCLVEGMKRPPSIPGYPFTPIKPPDVGIIPRGLTEKAKEQFRALGYIQ